MGLSGQGKVAGIAGRAAGRALLTGLACLAAAFAWADLASAAVRVHMVDGRTIEATSYRIEAGLTLVQVGEGDTFGFPSARVARIEAIDSPGSGPVTETETDSPAPASTPAPCNGDARAPLPMPAAPGAVEQEPVNAPGRADATDIDALIRNAAQRHHLEPELLAAVIAVESGYRPTATSPKGAQGLMQLMPATAKDLALKDPFDPARNIEAGATYLRQLLDRHGDSFVTALAAYNAGTGRVARQRGIPPYRETMQYIDRVLKRYGAATRDGIASLNPAK